MKSQTLYRALRSPSRRTGALALTVVVACTACARASTAADDTLDRSFGAPRCVDIRGYAGDAMEPFVTRDGAYLLFNSSNAPDAQTDLQVARLESDSVARYLGPLPGANSAQLDGVATTTSDGRLYFVSTRSFATSGATVYTARFTSRGVVGVTLVGGLPRERGVLLFDVDATADGRALVLSRGEFRGGPVPRTADLVVAVGRGSSFTFSRELTAVMGAVNTPNALEYAAALSPDARELFFTRATAKGAVIYRAVRSAAGAVPFGRPARVAAIEGFVEGPALSPSGSLLYYHKRVGDRFRICRVRRLAGR